MSEPMALGDRVVTETAPGQPPRRIRQLREMPYRHYLLTQHWHSVRHEALTSARYRCQWCGGRGTLDVHHLRYENLGAEVWGDLAVLCRSCHASEHGV